MLRLGHYIVIKNGLQWCVCVNMMLAITRNGNCGPHSHIVCSILEMSETKEALNLTANECNNFCMHVHTSSVPDFYPIFVFYHL